MGRGASQATVHGILQARILEWVAISFSREENGTHITQIIIGGDSGLVTKLCPTPVPHGQRSLTGYSPWDSPGKDTGVGCHFLLQGRKWNTNNTNYY